MAQPNVYFVRCYLLKDQAGIKNVSQDLYATLSDNGHIINKEDYKIPATGMKDIEKEYQLADPIEENVFKMSSEQRKQRGIGTLPGNLSEAISLTENSQLVRKALGDHIFNSFIKNKKIEWDQYRIQVSEYELKKYVPIL